MKPTRQFVGRAKIGPSPLSYRPRLDPLEERVPPGDVFLGAWLSSWLLGPSLALVDAGMAFATGGDQKADWGSVATSAVFVRHEEALSEPPAPLEARRASSVGVSDDRGRGRAGLWAGPARTRTGLRPGACRKGCCEPHS